MKHVETRTQFNVKLMFYCFKAPLILTQLTKQKVTNLPHQTLFLDVSSLIAFIMHRK